MICFAIGEPQYESSNWYKRIVSGILNEKRQKRFMLILLSGIEELKGFSITESDVLLVIGTGAVWLDEITEIAKMYFGNRIIVLGNHTPGLKGKMYSVVTGDIAKDIKTLYNYLVSAGKSRICLYGVNPNSVSDRFKEESFLTLCSRSDSVLYNKGSLLECFENFSKRIDEFDACICVNDFAALSLVNRLEDKSSKFVVSYGGSSLAAMHSPSITHINSNLDNFAGASIDLAKLLCKNKSINSVVIHLSSTFFPGETTGFAPLEQCEDTGLKNEITDFGDELFYSDEEVKRMIKVETLLTSLCDSDFIIVELLLDGKTYEEIAAKVNMSVNGIKYKLKNMFEICRVNSRKEFVSLVEEYVK